MIGSLRGTVLHRQGGDLTIEVGGVGYRVNSTAAQAASVSAEHAFMWIYDHQREDGHTLYGFTDVDSRSLFEVLIGTHGVGPALALAIMSTLSASELHLAVAGEDVARLCTVPGVGKKTAERLMIELKSRLHVEVIDMTGHSSGAAMDLGPLDEVRAALFELGYGADEVMRATKSLASDGEVSALLREALGVLAR